ncbi:DUF4097 family beta strand repeat-containing protein [Pengzhenrongella sicca]|uniref:DUF4097 family beta strand repeat protein n=1 Tax=Pengzhenrongella sicca TaxID=2819238 RepID=A0A8A4ZK36_9MICO|nr:DUF4097 family beta strand repeat-containing protein [Pengzhenrongella sicca]QTE30876.1 DUF4097 family beta strand repeat protein [Pengzhenrongella sicca]
MTNETTTPATADPVAPGPAARRAPDGRRALRVVGVSTALLLVLVSALSVVSLLSRLSEHHTGSYAGIRTVEIHAGFEDVELTGSATATSVSMDRAAAWSLFKPVIAERLDGDRLVISSRCQLPVGLGCSGHIILVVPAGVAVQLFASDGTVQVGEMSGPTTLNVEDGRTILRALSGEVDVTSSDGDITGTDLAGGLTVRTSDGSVDLTGLRSTRVDAQTSDGDVRLDFAAAPISVTAQTDDGSIRVIVPNDGDAYRVIADVGGDGRRTVTVPADSRSDRSIELRAREGSIDVGTTP